MKENYRIFTDIETNPIFILSADELDWNHISNQYKSRLETEKIFFVTFEQVILQFYEEFIESPTLQTFIFEIFLNELKIHIFKYIDKVKDDLLSLWRSGIFPFPIDLNYLIYNEEATNSLKNLNPLVCSNNFLYLVNSLKNISYIFICNDETFRNRRQVGDFFINRRNFKYILNPIIDNVRIALNEIFIREGNETIALERIAIFEKFMCEFEDYIGEQNGYNYI